MSRKMRSAKTSAPKCSIGFTAYGVDLELISNERRLLDEAFMVADRSLLGNISQLALPASRKTQRFELIRSSARYYRIFLNGEQISSGPSRWKFLKFFDGLLRVTVGEHSPEFVFIHAGVVAWKDKAILMPANSFDGKSTLVTELVKLGAVYYSDEFAIVDKNGLIRPFARPINMRTDDGNFTPYEISPYDLNADIGIKPIRCGSVFFTKYKKRSPWRPRNLSKGEALLELIPFTLPIRVHPEFSLSVLNKLLDNAILTSCNRSEAKHCAPKLLELVDKS